MALNKLSLLAIVLALAATACGAAREAPAPQSAAGPRGLYTVGADVFGLASGPVRLATPPVAPLAGWLTPAAVPSPDGRYLAYNAWKELRHDDPALSWSDQGIGRGDPLATPSVRLYDTSDESDRVLADGAFSLAWRGDGALAYFKGAERDYRAAVVYEGDVFVRASLDADPVKWTPARGRYIVVAWAGGTLVAYREREGEALDVLAFDGPGRMRVLAADSALVALSPDGRQAFVEQGPAEGRPTVRVVDVATGRQAAKLDLTRIEPAVGAVGYAGDWRGDQVVASSASGLAIFRIGPGTITFDQNLRIPSRGLSEPRFADASGRHVTAWASTPSGGVLFECDRTAGGCTRFTPLPHARGVHGFPVWRRTFYNPSRPLQEG